MSAVTPSFLPEDKFPLIESLVSGLPVPALQWLSGYMAGVASERRAQAGGAPGLGLAPAAAPAPLAPSRQRLSIVYGSQTGNAKRAAEQLAAQAQAEGLSVRLLRADAYPQRELKDEKLLYIVMSTQGDGDPPDDSLGFVEFLVGRRAPKLDGLKYAVLGLGDSSYPEFCGISRKIDLRLGELGGERLQDTGNADLDIDTVAVPWQARAVEQARDLLKTDATPLASVTPLRPAPAAPAYSRLAPYAAEILTNQRVTARNSDRDLRHIELSLEGSGLSYQPGDALGVWPTQNDGQVRAVLDGVKLDPGASVTHGEETLPLAQWLGQRRELTRLTRPFLAAHAERNGDARLAHALTPQGREELAALFDGYQLPDLLRDFPAEWTPADLVSNLRALAPRMYSIASSQEEVGEEAHLTIANVAYTAFGQPRWGVASRFLADAEETGSIPVFIEKNDRFRLPDDAARDVIMIGPGTGVAPFRAFVQHRAALGAPGRNWLFFGNPTFTADFLYQVEWQKALASGTLNRIDLAFSRDQAQKIYVQHRLREQGRDIFDWLENGAHLYVCGDATNMARDVHQALLGVAMTHGGHDQEAASAWLAELAAQGRYQRDVY